MAQGEISMNNKISIQKATLDDIAILAHHRLAMYTDMGMGTPTSRETAIELFVPYLKENMPRGGYQGWLAKTNDGQVVGGGGLIVEEWPAAARDQKPQSRRAYILNIYTEPEYRGRGIARQIMTAIIDWCRAEGLETVSLHASSMGRPLYESMGFEPTNEMRLKL
jgi:GNAT superfamily N-acetyltransferase